MLKNVPPSRNRTQVELAIEGKVGKDVGLVSNSTVADHAVIRGDGGSRSIQTSGIVIDDSDNMDSVAGINAVFHEDSIVSHEDSMVFLK